MVFLLCALYLAPDCPPGTLISEFGCVQYAVCTSHGLFIIDSKACVRNCSVSNAFNSWLCDKYCVYPLVRDYYNVTRPCVKLSDLAGAFASNNTRVSSCDASAYYFAVGANTLCVSYNVSFNILPALLPSGLNACLSSEIEFRSADTNMCPDFTFLPDGFDFMTVKPSYSNVALKRCPNTLICLLQCPDGSAALNGKCTAFSEAVQLYGISGRFITGCDSQFKDDGFCVSRCGSGRCANQFNVCADVPAGQFIGAAGQCVLSCDVYSEGANCVAVCSSGYGIDSTRDPKLCVANSPGKYLNDTQWVTKCDPLLREGKKCVYQCSDGYGTLGSSTECQNENDTSYYLEDKRFIASCSLGKLLLGKRCVDTCDEVSAILDVKKCSTAAELASEPFFKWSGFKVVNSRGEWATTCDTGLVDGNACVLECSFERAVLDSGVECVSDDSGVKVIKDNKWENYCDGRLQQGRYCVFRCADGFGHYAGYVYCQSPGPSQFILTSTSEINDSCTQMQEIHGNTTYCVSACSAHFGTTGGGDLCVNATNQTDLSLFLHGSQWKADPCTKLTFNRECVDMCQRGTGILETELAPRKCHAAGYYNRLLDVESRKFVAVCPTGSFQLTNSSGSFCLSHCEGTLGYFKSRMCIARPGAKFLRGGLWVESCDAGDFVEASFRCVSVCSEGYRLFRQECITNTSIDGCTAESGNVISNGSCAKQCSSDTALESGSNECKANPGGKVKLNDVWADSCANYFLFKDVCYASCPDGTARNGTLRQCFSKSEMYNNTILKPFVAIGGQWKYVCRDDYVYHYGFCLNACPPLYEVFGAICRQCASYFYYPDLQQCKTDCTADRYENSAQCLSICNPQFHEGRNCAAYCYNVGLQYVKQEGDKKVCTASCAVYNASVCVAECEAAQLINDSEGIIKCVSNCTSNIYELRSGKMYCVEPGTCAYMTYDDAKEMYQCVSSCEFALETMIAGVTVCFPHLQHGKYFYTRNDGQKIVVDACPNYAVVTTRYCVDSCPSYLFAEQKRCHSFCDKFVFVDTDASGLVRSLYCVPTCPSSAKFHDSNRQCVDKCPGDVGINNECVDVCLAYENATCLLQESDFEDWQMQRKSYYCHGMFGSFMAPGCQINGLIVDLYPDNIVSVNDLQVDGEHLYVMDVNNTMMSNMNLYLSIPSSDAFLGKTVSVFRRLSNATLVNFKILGDLGGDVASRFLVYSGKNVNFQSLYLNLSLDISRYSNCTDCTFSFSTGTFFSSYAKREIAIFGKNYRVMALKTATDDAIASATRQALNLSFFGRHSRVACFEQGDQFCYMQTDGSAHTQVICSGAACTYTSFADLDDYAFGLSCSAHRLGAKCVGSCPLGYKAFSKLCVVFCPRGYIENGTVCQKATNMPQKTSCPIGYELISGACIEQQSPAILPCTTGHYQGWSCVPSCNASTAESVATGSMCLLCSGFYALTSHYCVDSGAECLAGQAICPLRCSATYQFNYAAFKCVNKYLAREYAKMTPDGACDARYRSQDFNNYKYCVDECANMLVAQPQMPGTHCAYFCDFPYFLDEFRVCRTECPMVAVQNPQQSVCTTKCPKNQLLDGRLCVDACPSGMFVLYRPDYTGIFSETFGAGNYSAYLAAIKIRYSVIGYCASSCKDGINVYNLTNCTTPSVDCAKSCAPNCRFLELVGVEYYCKWQSQISSAITGNQVFEKTMINGKEYYIYDQNCGPAASLRRIYSNYTYNDEFTVNFVECVSVCRENELYNLEPIASGKNGECVLECSGSGHVINHRTLVLSNGASIEAYVCDSDATIYNGDNFITYYAKGTHVTGVAGWYSSAKCGSPTYVVEWQNAFYKCRNMDPNVPKNNTFAAALVRQTSRCLGNCEQYLIWQNCTFQAADYKFVVRKVYLAPAITYYTCYVSNCPTGMGRMYQHGSTLSGLVECFDSCRNFTLQNVSGNQYLMSNESGFCAQYGSAKCNAYHSELKENVVSDAQCGSSCGSSVLAAFALQYSDPDTLAVHCVSKCWYLELLFAGKRFMRKSGRCVLLSNDTVRAECHSMTINSTDAYCLIASECKAPIDDYFFEYPTKHCTDCPAGKYGLSAADPCVSRCPAGLLADKLLRICVAERDDYNLPQQWRAVNGEKLRCYNCADLSASEITTHQECCKNIEFLTAEGECRANSNSNPDVYNPGECDSYSEPASSSPRICVNCTTALEDDGAGAFKCVPSCSRGHEFFNPGTRRCYKEQYAPVYAIPAREYDATPIKQNLHLRESWICVGACAVLCCVLAAVLARFSYKWWYLAKPIRFVEMRVPGLLSNDVMRDARRDDVILPTDDALDV